MIFESIFKEQKRGDQRPTTAVIPRSEATWESPGRMCDFGTAYQEIATPLRARNDDGRRSLPIMF